MTEETLKVHEETIAKYNKAHDAMIDLLDDVLFPQSLGSQVLSELNSLRSQAEISMECMIADNADAHSCYSLANNDGGFCTICGADVRTNAQHFTPCELGTCTCCY